MVLFPTLVHCPSCHLFPCLESSLTSYPAIPDVASVAASQAKAGGLSVADVVFVRDVGIVGAVASNIKLSVPINDALPAPSITLALIV